MERRHTVAHLTGALFTEWTKPVNETVLYNFTGQADGARPSAGVIRDSDGNLYGSTSDGGTGCGVVYKLDATGHETVLLTLSDNLGCGPQGGLALDAAGNLYGTTFYGQADEYGAGIVFKLDTSGQEIVLHSFTISDGEFPTGNLALDAAGNLYGTTINGGISGTTSGAGYGVVYKVNPAGQQTVLHNFTGWADGGNPQSGVILDSAGNLYGTAAVGGTANAGVVFRLAPNGIETVLYNFTGGDDGGSPYGGLVRDPSGNFYGTASFGGPYNTGVVFKLTPSG
jgi:uncharacterized repeat protein (TIGR03803 family)